MIEILYFILSILKWVIIIQAIMSWLFAFNVADPHHGPLAGIWDTMNRVTEPLYAPIRKFMPDFGGLDLSPMVVLLAIFMIEGSVLPALAGSGL